MLKVTAYLNIVLAIAYFLLYLLNSNSYTMAGVLIVFLFGVLVVWSEEKQVKFKALHYIIGAASLVFVRFLLVWVFNVIESSVEHQYFNNTWLYILLTIVFVLSIVLQFILMYLADRKRSKA